MDVGDSMNPVLAMIRRENTEFSGRRSRWCSSPSLLSTQFARQSADGPEVTPWWAGNSLLRCGSFGCVISCATWSCRNTASP